MKFCPSCSARYEDAAKFCQHDGTLLRSTGAGSDEDPYVGQVLLGQFEIKEVIGEGGMGRVYRAHQHGFDRPVAIKILHTDLVTNQEMVKRFNREAKIISRLDHPSIIHVYLFGELPDGNLYLAMEFVDGAGLTKLINEGPAPVADTVHIGRQILGALTEAHRKGVVHRDLKPDNIMLVERPDDPLTVKVLDFGIAKFLGSRTMLTQQGLVFGSARYISPEAAAGETVDERADLYAVGVILYQMLAGRPPFDDASAVSLLMRHVNDPPPPLLEQPGARGVPEVLAQVVMQALEKDPSHRFDGAGAMRTALTEAARVSGIVLPGEASGAPMASWAPPVQVGAPDEGRGEAFKTDPMFGGAIASGEAAPAAGAKGPLPSASTGPEQKSARPSGEVTAPELPSTRIEPPPEPAPDTDGGEVALEPAAGYVDPNDDEIELPKSRAWLVLVVIAILALAGGALGALIALETEGGTPPAEEAGPSPEPVVASVTQPPPDPLLPDPLLPDAGPSNQAPLVDGGGQKTVEPATGDGGVTGDAGATLVKGTAPPSRPTKGADPQVMPPSATLSLEPARPLTGQSVRLEAKVSPATVLRTPRFVITPRGGEAIWREAKSGAEGIYEASYTFEKVGSYQISFVATSGAGEVRAFSDAVVSPAKRRTQPTKVTTPRDLPPPLTPQDASDNKPPDHEEGPPRLLEPWSTPW